MTREEAIRHFEAQAQCNYKPTREAAELAIAALRAQKAPAKLDRSHWEGCGYCSDPADAETNEFLFCPYCGCPLTEEAWAEVERRISDG